MPAPTTTPAPTGSAPKISDAQRSPEMLRDVATKDISETFARLKTSATGLTEEEACERLEIFGPNEVAQEHGNQWVHRLWLAIRNPLVILLSVLAIVTFATA